MTLSKVRLATAALLLLLNAGAAAADPLTNDDVLRLTKAGVGEAAIVAMIDSSATDFDTDVDAVVALAEAGVGDAVIAAMVNAQGTPPSAAAGTSRGDAPGSSGVQPKAIPGSTFREALRSGGEGPLMVVIPAGSFLMGCSSDDESCEEDARPVHDVTIRSPFALSVHEVTFEDYDRFTHPNLMPDEGWGRGRRPAVHVSWDDAQDYVRWLSAETGAEYRLPSEAEWEYAARAGAETRFHWGAEVGRNRANCAGCGSQWDDRQTAPVGSFPPNPFGLHDMHGNVLEWVADCYQRNYAGAPVDGSARTSTGLCQLRVRRSGSWWWVPQYVRASFRWSGAPGDRDNQTGLRVARTLVP